MQGKDVGDAFVDAALVPIRQATERLRNGAIEEGLAGFGQAALLDAARSGVKRAAAALGCATSEVEAVLEWPTFEPAAQSVHAAQEAAIRAFREHASAVGGLLTGFSRNTAVEVYRQSGALSLRNMAQRFVRDKHLCEPLEKLADSIAAWEALIATGGDKLEHSKLVTRALGRQRVIRAIVAGIGAIVVLGAAGYAYTIKQAQDARQRVEQAVSHADPCKAESIAAEDLVHAMPDQIRRRDERKAECASVRAREAHEQACKTLANHFRQGKLDAADMTEANEAKALFVRAIERKLDPTDLSVTRKDMPCQDTETRLALFSIYAVAVAQSKDVWLKTQTVSDDLREELRGKALVEHKDWQDELRKHAEELSAKAILSGKPEEMQQAKEACEFYKSFGLEFGMKCTGLMTLMKPK